MRRDIVQHPGIAPPPPLPPDAALCASDSENEKRVTLGLWGRTLLSISPAIRWAHELLVHEWSRALHQCVLPAFSLLTGAPRCQKSRIETWLFSKSGFIIDLGKLASVTALVTILSQSLWFQPIFLILPMAHLLLVG